MKQKTIEGIDCLGCNGALRP